MESNEFGRFGDRLARLRGRLAVIGTAKNAGKTTVLNYLLRLRDGRLTGVTSIGRDGEPCDVLEKHPKPSIHIASGTLFATARDCLSRSSGRWVEVEATSFETPLGKILLGRAQGDCRIELAGPSGVNQMLQVVERMEALGATRVLIDGAFDRVAGSAASLCGKVVLAAGSAGRHEVEQVVTETLSYVKRYRIEPVPADLASVLSRVGSYSGEIRRLNSLTDEQLPALQGCTVILPDPSCCLIDWRSWKWIDSGHLRLFVEQPVRLLAVFVSPFRPHLQPLPARQLLESVRSACGRELVFDLNLEGQLKPC